MRKVAGSAKRVVIVGLLLLTVGALVLHWRYPLPYVYRVMVYQDSDFDDIHHFPASVIAASGNPALLPSDLDPTIAEVFVEHPDVDTLDGLLGDTQTSALLVVHQGQLIFERYLLGHDMRSPQNSFSISKSVTSALVGLAAADGVLDLEAPITDYLPELLERDPRFAAITPEDLLNMRSGIAYDPNVSFPFVTSDDPLIYYSLDLTKVLLERTRVTEPPGEFHYNNFNTPLLGQILRRTTGQTVSALLAERLWHPMGARYGAGWTTDDHAVERMESGFHASARDLARFGLLYLNRGRVEGLAVVPEAWVLKTTRFDERPAVEQYDGRAWGYRRGWWLIPRSQGASDFAAIGRYGQFVYVSPQFETVFVRTGPDRGQWGDRDWTALFYFVAERLGVAARNP